MFDFFLIALIFLVGSWLQGAVGFGMGMIGAPVLALLRPDLLPATVIFLAFFTALFVLIREWSDVNWRYFGWALIGRLPGTALGAIAVSAFAPMYISLLVGLAVLGGVALSFFGWYPRPRGGNLLIGGFLSGIFGTATSIGGPPLAIVMRRVPPATVRATMSAYFAFGSIISLAALWLAGSFDATHLSAAAGIAPFILIGLILSNVVGRRFKRDTLFLIGTTAALFSALLVIIDSIRTIWV